MERLSTLSSTSSSSVEIEEISADKSGRSFVMRIVGCEHLYFWCSEKSKLLGEELLDKVYPLICSIVLVQTSTGVVYMQMTIHIWLLLTEFFLLPLFS